MSPKAAQVTVAIPTIGRIEMLSDCLASIAIGTVLPQEVLIVDQSGDKKVAELLSQNSLPIRHKVCSGRGIAKNMNLVLREATYEHILVTHDDCTVATDWVEQATAALAINPGGIVTGRVFPGGDDPDAVPSTNRGTEPYDFTGTVAHGVLYPNNMGLYRSEALEIGGFDERNGFRTAAEDLDFSYRWLKAGRPLHYVPSMAVTHNDWRSPDELVKLYKHYARCAGRFYGKHLYTRDPVIARQTMKDFRLGLSAWKEMAQDKGPRWKDERRELPIWMPIGVVEGLWETWRLDRQN